MSPQILMFSWDGEAMVPARGHAKRCDEKFTVGETYRMEVSEARSHRSHRHYFAAVHEAWLNLPEHLAERFPSPDHLRKWALVQAGFCDCRELAFDCERSAQIGAEAFREADPYAVMVVTLATLRVFRPHSQDLRSMNKAQFQASKEAVLDKVAQLVGTTAEALQENARSAA